MQRKSLCKCQRITKTYLHNFDPLKPDFYKVKLGLQGYTLFFLFLLKNIVCGYLLEPPQRGGSNEYDNLHFEQMYEKISEFYLKTFSFWWWKFSIYLNSRVFVMESLSNLTPFSLWMIRPHLHIDKIHVNKIHFYVYCTAPCENVSLDISEQQRPRSACASAQSDLGLTCPLTESLDTTECMSEEQRP